MYILDPSVAIKWFFNDEEKAPEAQAILVESQGQLNYFCVPEFFFTEFSSVFFRKSNYNLSMLQNSLRLLDNLGMSIIPSSREGLLESAEVAAKLKISLYDAIYASLAQTLGFRWLTADRRAVHNLKSAHYKILS